jgi:hypothetical protein
VATCSRNPVYIQQLRKQRRFDQGTQPRLSSVTCAPAARLMLKTPREAADKFCLLDQTIALAQRRASGPKTICNSRHQQRADDRAAFSANWP